MTKVKCDYCGKEINIPPSRLKNNKHSFCNKECYHLYSRQENIIFEKEGQFYIKIFKDNKEFNVLIDQEDISKINMYKWHIHERKRDSRYDVCAIKRNTTKNDSRYILLSRYLIDCPNDKVVDHLDKNTLNNMKSNLLITNTFCNNLNKDNNTSGCIGVTWDKSKNKWVVSICGKYLGRYNTIEEAIEVRKKAEADYLSRLE